MQRRKFIAGVGSLAAGAAAVTGTGAVSSVTADRSISISVAADDSAYLGLDAGSNDYVTNSGGNGNLLKFNFDGSSTDANGLNNQADTIIESAFDIENNSDRDLFVWAPSVGDDTYDSGGARSLELLVPDNNDGTLTDITFPSGETKDPETSRVVGQTSTTGAVKIPSGKSRSVEMRFLVFGSSGPRDIDSSIIFKAEDERPGGEDAWDISSNGAV